MSDLLILLGLAAGLSAVLALLALAKRKLPKPTSLGIIRSIPIRRRKA